MRRPAAACAAGFSAGIAVYSATGSISVLLAGTGFLLLFLLNKWNLIEKYKINVNVERDSLFTSSSVKKTAAIFLLFFAAGSLRYAVSDMNASSFEGRSGETAEITGDVLSEEIEDDRRVLELSVDGDGIFREKILVTVEMPEAGKESRAIPQQTGGDSGRASGRIDEESQDMEEETCLTGMRVTVLGVLREPESQGNPGVFDYRRYLKSCGIRMTMRADESGLSVCGGPEGIYILLNTLEKFRRNYLSAASGVMGEEATGLLAGILFGDRTRMDEEIYGTFQKNGTAHLLAVSGLHISMIYGLLAAVCRNPATAAGNLPAAAILILYAALSGFSPSVVRAVFMILTQIAARMMHRRYDGLSGISFCAFSLLMYRPSMLFSSGFQLSFLAVLTISIVMSGTGKKRRGTPEREKNSRGFPGLRQRAGRQLKEQAAGIFLMQAGMMPVTLRQFHYISPAAFLLNPPAIALAGFIVPAGVAMMPFCVAADMEFFPDFLREAADLIFRLLCAIEEMLLSLLIFLNGLPEGTVFDYRYAASPPACVFLIYYAALFFFFSEAGRDFIRDRKRRMKRMLCVFLIFVSAGCCAGMYADRAARAGDLIFLDVGQGDCAHLRDGGTNLLFDSGGSDTYDVGENILLPYFLSGGVSEIDLAVISHLHTDHCGGLISLLRGVRVRKMMLSAVYEARAEEISEMYGIPREDLLFVREGDRIAVGNVTLDVLAPARAGPEEYSRILENSEDENELCLIVKAEYRGRSVLFTGDIDADYEKKLVSLCGGRLKTDILKTAHHGSRYSTCSAFLSAASPDTAVIQVGTNYYGHPSAETVERLENSGASVFRNDRDGAIFADMKSGRILSMRDLQRSFFRD